MYASKSKTMDMLRLNEINNSNKHSVEDAILCISIIMVGIYIIMFYNISNVFAFNISIPNSKGENLYIYGTVYQNLTIEQKSYVSGVQENEEWFMDQKGRIRNRYDNVCLDVRGRPEPGVPVWAHPCHNGVNQQWTIVGTKIQAFGGSKFCLDVPYADISAGKHLWIWPCNSTAAQKWHIGSVSIKTARDSLMLGVGKWYYPELVPYGSDTSRWEYDDQGRLHCFDGNCLTPVQYETMFIQECKYGLSTVHWAFDKGQIRALGRSGYCLDVPEQRFEIGQQTQIWPCNGTIAQKWIVE